MCACNSTQGLTYYYVRAKRLRVQRNQHSHSHSHPQRNGHVGSYRVHILYDVITTHIILYSRHNLHSHSRLIRVRIVWLWPHTTHTLTKIVCVFSSSILRSPFSISWCCCCCCCVFFPFLRLFDFRCN